MTKEHSSFGALLKTTREELGLDRKDVAAQLRLSERIIVMMEKDRFPSDLPLTFVRGYIRAYGKLLQLPEQEINKALGPIKPKPLLNSTTINKNTIQVTSGNYFMQIFTYLILFTIIGLVGMWWYTHTLTETPVSNLVAKDAIPEVAIVTSPQKEREAPAEVANPPTIQISMNKAKPASPPKPKVIAKENNQDYDDEEEDEEDEVG